MRNYFIEVYMDSDIGELKAIYNYDNDGMHLLVIRCGGHDITEAVYNTETLDTLLDLAFDKVREAK